MVSQEPGRIDRPARAWSLRREWSRAFTIMLVLLLVASLAIIRAHNRWAHDWTVLVTLAGWFGVVPGLFRMSATGLYQRSAADTSTTVFVVLGGVLFVCGLIMRFKVAPFHSIQIP